MRVVVITGSRDWTEVAPIESVVVGADLVIHGGAPGADAIAHDVAIHACIDVLVMPARWRARGKSAGSERNERMAQRAATLMCAGDRVRCYAFPLPGSVGTWDCVRRMREHGVPTTVYGESEVR